jgi:mannose-6-phosphate isomerase-like protein (cupin superfamily)
MAKPGKGRVEAGGNAAELEEGTAVFLPAGLGCRFLNPSSEALEMYLVTEETAPGFVPPARVGQCLYRFKINRRLAELYKY